MSQVNYQENNNMGGFYIFNGTSDEKEGQVSSDKKYDIVALVVFKEIQGTKYYYHCRITDKKISDEDSVFLEKFVLEKVDENDPLIKDNTFDKYSQTFIKYFDNQGEPPVDKVKGEGEEEEEE